MKYLSTLLVAGVVSLCCITSASPEVKTLQMLEIADTSEGDATIALTALQVTVNRIMRIWTLLDIIQAMQGILPEHMTLFAREMLEEALHVYIAVDKLLQDSSIVSDTETVLYLYELVGRIDQIRATVFIQYAQHNLEDIICFQVIMQLLQKKLMLSFVYQQ